jgi:hypothetical protein
MVKSYEDLTLMEMIENWLSMKYIKQDETI